MIVYGSNIGINGWALVSTTEQPDGSTETILRGAVTKLKDALAYARKQPNDEITVDKDPSTGVATITITASADSSPSTSEKPEETGLNDPNLSEPPEVTLSGSMASVPIHQSPYFGLGEDGSEDLTVQDAQKVETLIRDNGTVTQADCGTDKMADYASWRLIGQETFLKPTYTLNITFHLTAESRAEAKNYIQTAGKVVTWGAALAKVPAARKPPQPSGFDQWLACAPTVAQTQTGCDVTISFIGAKAFPNYYSGGSWTPPPLDTGLSDSGGTEGGSDSGETQS